MSEGNRSLILLADDSPFFRRYLAELLSSEGFDVLPAADGSALMQQIEEHGDRVDGVLVDLSMPGGGALELLPLIRDRFSRDALPVLVLAQSDEIRDLSRARDSGANGHVLKQAPAEHIMFRIREMVSRRDGEKRLSQRHLVDAALHYEGGGYHGIGRLVDLSVGGLLAVSMGPPPPVDACLELSFVVPDTDDEVTVRGRIARSGHLRVAVVFEPLDSSAEASIADYLERHAE